jgi:hypothetical protein
MFVLEGEQALYVGKSKMASYRNQKKALLEAGASNPIPLVNCYSYI